MFNISVNQIDDPLRLLDNPLTCPGLFYATPAIDGVISRIRIPGGILTSHQVRVIADYANIFGGDGSINVTNRANLQVRGIRGSEAALITLRSVELAGIPEVDHIRNIMASPTAGIDSSELIDTRYLVRELDEYICSHKELGGLSPKFSVAFDGGGKVSVCQQPNEITFSAVKENTFIYFHLLIGGEATNILLKPEECLFVVAALAQLYLNEIDITEKRKPRLKKLFQEKGLSKTLEQAQKYLPFPLNVSNHTYHINTNTNYHLGAHPQRQKGYSYIGIVLPLGKLNINQLYNLANLVDTYGSGSLRLTPWQNLIIPDIKSEFIPQVQEHIENLGLHWSANHIYSGLVACTGNKGCASSATDTKTDALALAEYLQQHISLDIPIKIHFTGCSKSCAYHGKSDITLLGAQKIENNTTIEGYQVFVGSYEQPFGREIYSYINQAELPEVILRLLQVYKLREDANESFGEWVDRYLVSELQHWFYVGGIA
ncbi:precorrin-3B synthase [Calothrix sp. NIES-4071]|nr:precorrin-3B synthase [Calothrix sp. NIES-4071]BAZ56206.1 precorrin-3B synthase [Calothrix sp. NIES-4105]